MRNILSSIFSQREKKFSYFWLRIVQTRFALCLILIASLFLLPEMYKLAVFIGIAIYTLINICLGFFRQNTLLQRRFRIIPAIVDVIFISFLIYHSGGQNSPWFILYVFPIVSVSRYLSYEGSVPLSIFSIIGFIVSTLIGLFIPALISEQKIELPAILLKSLLLLAIGFVAGNITKTKRHEEDNLVEIYKKIDEAIIETSDSDAVLKLILEKALDYTKSDFGQLILLNNEGESKSPIRSVRSADDEKDFSLIQAVVDKNSERVKVSKKTLLVPLTKSKTGKTKYLSGFILFVPLIINGKVMGIITLVSNDRYHYYSKEDGKVLGNFAPLLGITLKFSELYQEIKNSNEEKKERLKMLFEIGKQLTVDTDLDDVFKKVVDLTYTRLQSEEAALFIWDEDKQCLNKVDVQGPDEEISSKLLQIENTYEKGKSLVGGIFKTKEPIFDNNLGKEVEHKGIYSEILPSKSVKHYIGVPLIINDQALGVLRVINKKLSEYSIEKNCFDLSDEGFSEEDFELMNTLASQVASAIWSAKFVEVKRKYEVLVENSPDPIIVLDRDGKIEVFNKACENIWGLKADEVKGKPAKNYYKSEEHARNIGRKLKEEKRIENFVAQIKDHNNVLIPISLSASLLFDKEGKKVGSIGVFKDLRETQRLEAERSIAAQLASLGKLAHTTGHDVKHDLATALNYIDVLAFESQDEDLLEVYRDIQESLNDAFVKFQNMLMVGKPKPLNKKLIGSSEVFRIVEEAMKRRAKSAGIDFIMTYPESDDEMKADIEQLKQALMNLFNNSMDAFKTNPQSEKSTEKGKIEIIGSTNKGELEIVLKDNGCGIPLEYQSKVFLPFETSKDTGNGLGLYNVKSIIENHGGVIDLRSEEGKGTTFTILIPFFNDDSE